MKPIRILFICLSVLIIDSCQISKYNIREANRSLPKSYTANSDTSQKTNINWRSYYTDPFLIALIDTALNNNQELNIMLHEIEISKNEIMARKGEYLPFGNISAGTGLDRSGKYTFNGMSEEDVKNRGELPTYIGEQYVGLNFSWELDVWKKLRNAKKAAALRYLSTIEGRNYTKTQMVAEIAQSYYELITLDYQLSVVNQNIQIQKDAFEAVKVQKEAARVNQLAVNRFEAQWLNTQNLKYQIQQNIVEAENKINFLVGRLPQPVKRFSGDLNAIQNFQYAEGFPSDLLVNRPDIRSAELELEANKLDVKSAKANFYPNFTLRAGVGLQGFNPAFIFNPESIAYNAIGDMVAPLINRNAIRATYNNANERQIQAVFNYEKTILNAFYEVSNQLNANKNYTQSFQTKSKQVDILSKSIDISNSLFNSARADYTEVLLTQREALDAKLELIEIKRNELQARVNIYKALGGGWN